MSNCKNTKNSDYEVDIRTNINYHQRDFNHLSKIRPCPKNGEIYGGEESNDPWMPIKVTPTATNYISRNLLSANPPPGAVEQYVGTNRIGNNYTAMPNIHWYNPNNTGPYNLKVTK